MKTRCDVVAQEWRFTSKGLLGREVCRLLLGSSQRVTVGPGENAAAVLALAGSLSLQALQLGLAKAGYLSKAFASVRPRGKWVGDPCLGAGPWHSPLELPEGVGQLWQQPDSCDCTGCLSEKGAVIGCACWVNSVCLDTELHVAYC